MSNSSRRSLAVCGAAAAAALCVSAWVLAGDTNPPPGPVAGTMHTLQELYDLVGQSSVKGSAGRWSYARVPTSAAGPTQIATGRGVMHAVVLFGCDCGSVSLYDSASTNISGAPVIVDLLNDVSFSGSGQQVSKVFELDIEFQNGLVLVPPPNASRPLVTVTYRLD